MHGYEVIQCTSKPAPRAAGARAPDPSTGQKPGAPAGPRYLPRRIDAVYLFNIGPLRAELAERGVGIGVATSVRKQYWQMAQIIQCVEALRCL